MAFIRKTKTGSGATAVQICFKERGKIVRVEHVGSAGSEAGVERLVKEARARMDAEKKPLFDLSDFDRKGDYGEK